MSDASVPYEKVAMPNKTIYVPDADLPIFLRAQELAGENLSATIAAALHRFVKAEEARQKGYVEIVVKTGEKGASVRKQFLGRELARQSIPGGGDHLVTQMIIYQTAKGRYAVHTHTGIQWSEWIRPDWSATQLGDHDWATMDWSAWSKGTSYRLDVYETLDELRPHIPADLLAAVERALRGEDVEVLDI